MADSLLYEQSLESQGESEPFISRQVVQVLDQNGGNYNGQIQIDTSSLSNSGKYASYGEAYLVIPLVTVLEATSANAILALNDANCTIPFGVGLKCGHHQMIHSLSVSYNNSDVVQLTPFTNFYVQYKLLTQFSWEDVKKIGPSIGFWPDNALSYDYREAPVADNSFQGVGVRNNRNAGTYPTVSGVDATGYTEWAAAKYNDGFLKRQEDTAYTRTAAVGDFIDDATTDTGISYYDNSKTDYKVWYTLAKIRLKDIHSFFEQLPLVKGAFITLRINTNTVNHNLASTTVVAHDRANLFCTSSVINGGTSPLLIATGGTFAARTGGMGPLCHAIGGLAGAPTDDTFSLRLSIGKDPTIAAASHPTWNAQTRLFVPLYQMSPMNEEKYLSINRTKRIVYEDIYSYQTNVGANPSGGFNQLLTNGIPNPTCVICIPFYQGSANCIGKDAGNNPTPTYQSPWASDPGTTSPLVVLKDFNVQVAGINMFTQNENWDFEQFVNELQSKHAINGGLVNGLTSGLISELDFKHHYRYYVCDVSRRLPAEDSVPKSISIQGTNLSNKAISIFTFVLFRREITIDLSTGQKLD